jgi:hypothetical protein
MIRMEDYGYCLEEYLYSLENGEVKEISYTQHDDKGNDVLTAGVEKRNGQCYQSVVRWSQNSIDNESHGYLNHEVPEMRLFFDYLNDENKKFKFEDITVYSYENAPVQNRDEYSIYPIKGRDDIELSIDRNNVAVCDENKVIKVYGRNSYGNPDFGRPYEEIRIFDPDAVVHELYSYMEVAVVSEMKKLSNSFYYSLAQSPIDVLQKKVTKYRNWDRNKEWKIAYDNDNMVETVSSLYNLLSRSESVTKETDNRSEVCEIKDSIYPTLLTPNHKDLLYPFQQLWTHDHMEKDGYGNIVEFERMIYFIDKDKLDDLHRILDKDVDKLMICN